MKCQERKSKQQADLIGRWSREVAMPRRGRKRISSRTFGALGILSREEQRDLVKLDQLLLVAIYDEPIGRLRPAIRVSGYPPFQATI